MIKTQLDQLLTGAPQPFAEDGVQSAIVKQPVEGPVWLDKQGLAGNRVADTYFHGGPDKAVHLYPREHYAFWQARYADLELLDSPGAFGENLSCVGLTEDKLCLGDMFRIGEAVIECSHARQPCWKLNHRFERKDVMKTVVQTGHSGSYFRVLEAGNVQVGDEIVQLEQPCPQWPLQRLFGLLIGGRHSGEQAALRELADMPVLAKVWRERAAQLAAA